MKDYHISAYYGIIKHPSFGCTKGLLNSKMHESNQTQYGPWLRALPNLLNRKPSSHNSERRRQLGSSYFHKHKGDVVVEAQPLRGEAS